MLNVRELLEPIADVFRGLNVPEPIVHWGHPLMMGIVVVVMGSYVGLTGWRSRVLDGTDGEAAIKNRADHRKLAPLMFLFIALGYTGGVLSLVMQGKPIFESSHFWTGTAALIFLTMNGAIAGVFGKNKTLRTIHAYLGSAILCLLFLHGVFGLKLGLSI